MFSFTLHLLHPHGKNLWYPLNKGLGGNQCQSGYCDLYTPSSKSATAVTIMYLLSQNFPVAEKLQFLFQYPFLLSRFLLTFSLEYQWQPNTLQWKIIQFNDSSYMHFYTLHASLHHQSTDCATVLYKHTVRDTVVWLTEGKTE